MENRINIVYQDKDLLVIDKPAFLSVWTAEKTAEKTLEDFIKENSPDLKNLERAGVVHRIDKDTSGIVLIAKNKKTLDFLQKEFKERKVTKKYLSLVIGSFEEREGKIESLIGRDPKNRKKQKAFFMAGPESEKEGKRKAETFYRVLKILSDGKNKYTLLEATPKTGRKHQIRAHLAFIGHPVAGDNLYGFKNQPCPAKINRQFLHASYLRIKMPGGEEKEFSSQLPQDLKKTLEELNELTL